MTVYCAYKGIHLLYIGCLSSCDSCQNDKPQRAGEWKTMKSAFSKIVMYAALDSSVKPITLSCVSSHDHVCVMCIHFLHFNFPTNGSYII